MTRTTYQAFNEFLERITPSSTQIGKIEERRLKTHNYLVKGFGAESEMPLTRTTLIGSAAKGTVTTPIDDIDVMAVFSDENGAFAKYSNSQNFLSKIRNALTGYRIETIGTRGQAVRLFYKDGLHVDIAPVFFYSDGSGYELPAGDGSWIMTNPDTQIAWFNRRDQELGHHLRHVVKLAKEWNKAHGHDLKSYHLETMVGTMFISLDSDYREALYVFFRDAHSYLSVQDPAGHSGDLGSYLSFQKYLETVERFKAACDRAAKANQAEINGDHKEAIRLWRIILGDRFPTFL